MERKALTLLILLTSSFYWLFSSPLIVSISFDVERDPPALTNGEEGFQGVGGIPHVLEVLDEHGAKATFFVTGRVADRHPDMLRTITTGDHETAVHGGYLHDDALSELPADEQVLLINATAAAVESATGIRPTGYRAPGHRVTLETMNALEDLGFTYDSSVVPSLTGRLLYGHSPVSPRSPYHPGARDIFSPGEMSIVEVPLTPVLFNGNLDSLLAYEGEAVTGFQVLLSAVDCRMRHRPLVIYLHPGHMVDLPNEPRDYRTGSHILHGLDHMLDLLDLLGAQYVRMEDLVQ